MKLYLVTLRGLRNPVGVDLNTSYVIANNPDEAYTKVRIFLDAKGLGYRHERELDSIRLLAEDYDYTDVRVRLFL